jgi:NAD(P)-dependent dehydrogenase (short-subunit alcohol dehydrogenase family)
MMAEYVESQRVALVTGASSGIGRSVAETLARAGYRTYGTSRVPRSERGLSFTMLPMDVCDDDSVNACVRTIVDAAGAIDVLVNNAGVSLVGAIEDTTLDELRALFETNLLGSVRMIHAVLPSMRERRRGHIVNVSSIAAQIGLPFRGGYSASKAALGALSEALCAELSGFGIAVTLVEPGDFRTRIHEARTIARRTANGSVYDPAFSVAARVSYSAVANAPPPTAVAGAILRAIAASPAPLRLRIGRPIERLSVAAKRLLPERWFQSVLMRYLNSTCDRSNEVWESQ